MKKFLMAVGPLVLAGLFAVLWLGECFGGAPKGDGMSDSTRARVARLAADSARFYRQQDSLTKANVARDSIVRVAKQRVVDIEKENKAIRASRQRMFDSTAKLDSVLTADSTARDSVGTLLQLRVQDKSVITSLTVENGNLIEQKDSLNSIIVKKDETIVADSIAKVELRTRIVDLEQVSRDLRGDLLKATECTIVFGIKCPSRKVVAVASYVLGAVTMGVAVNQLANNGRD